MSGTCKTSYKAQSFLLLFHVLFTHPFPQQNVLVIVLAPHTPCSSTSFPFGALSTVKMTGSKILQNTVGYLP